VDGDLGAVSGSHAHVASVPAIGDIDDVLAANRSFYDAFEARDLDAMSDLWEHSDRVCCTHPGWQRLDGWASVSASFYAIFTGPQPIQFILTSERADVIGDMAWVVVDENVLGGTSGATASAVNLFARNGDGRWRMIAHAASTVVG
jgi:ketosteroid isomerase-like protein